MFDELLERETTCTADIIASTIFRFSCGQIFIFIFIFFVVLTPWGLFLGTQIFQSNPLSFAGDSLVLLVLVARVHLKMIWVLSLYGNEANCPNTQSFIYDFGPILRRLLPTSTCSHRPCKLRAPSTLTLYQKSTLTIPLHIYTTKKVRKDNRGREERS